MTYGAYQRPGPAPNATFGPPSPAAPITLPTAAGTTTASSLPSNASELGDPTINVLAVFPNPLGPVGAVNPIPTPAPGALPPFTFADNAGNVQAETVSNSVVNLYWPGANAAALYISTGAAPTGVGLPSARSESLFRIWLRRRQPRSILTGAASSFKKS